MASLGPHWPPTHPLLTCGEASRAGTDTGLGTTGEQSQGKEAGLARGGGRGGAGSTRAREDSHLSLALAWHPPLGWMKPLRIRVLTAVEGVMGLSPPVKAAEASGQGDGVTDAWKRWGRGTTPSWLTHISAVASQLVSLHPRGPPSVCCATARATLLNPKAEHVSPPSNSPWLPPPSQKSEFPRVCGPLNALTPRPLGPPPHSGT